MIADLDPDALVALASIVDPDEHLAFVGLLHELDAQSCTFAVHDADAVELVGPEVAEWCERLVGHWCDFIVCVHAAQHQGARLIACDTCAELYLLPAAAIGSACLMSSCGGTRSLRPPITFTNPAEVAS